MNDNTEIYIQKKSLRRYIRELFTIIPKSKRSGYDKLLNEKFERFFAETIIPHFDHGDLTVLTYMPLPDEPSIGDILNVFPTIDCLLPISLNDGNISLRRADTQLQLGLYGILEPDQDSEVIAYSSVDVAVIPARAFGTNGSRLGRGKGYYDRFLANLDCLTIGLCYDEQIIPNIPLEPHDKGVNYIITPTKIYNCASNHRS